MKAIKRTNRAARRGILRGFSERMKRSEWGMWIWRNEAAQLPDAPKGLQRACLNGLYSVQFFLHQTEWGVVDRLLIRRHDGKTGIPWQHKQRLKNELMGEDRTAVEVFPTSYDLVDDANCYHIWVLPEGCRLPFNLADDSTKITQARPSVDWSRNHRSS